MAMLVMAMIMPPPLADLPVGPRSLELCWHWECVAGKQAKIAWGKSLSVPPCMASSDQGPMPRRW
eukprot:1018084-Pyramimonas_sp.AAC.1